MDALVQTVENIGNQTRQSQLALIRLVERVNQHAQAGRSGFLFDADQDGLVSQAEVETMVQEAGIANTPLHAALTAQASNILSGISWTNLLSTGVSNAVSGAQSIGEELVNTIADAALPTSDWLGSLAGSITAAQSMFPRT
eukprot:1391063-Pleurochrysis_carterae.AAC.1